MDDVGAASRWLSEMGLWVVAPAAQRVRAAMCDVATGYGWKIQDYDAFARWALERVRASERPWIVVDPLLDTSAMMNAHRVRLSRVLHGKEWKIELVEAAGQYSTLPSTSIGMLDDAAATGSTIMHMANVLKEQGATLAAVALCCISRSAHAALNGAHPSIEHSYFLQEGRTAIHLRDACAFLPFSGRPSASHPPISTAAGDIVVRFPSVTQKRGPWQHLFSDYRVLAATAYARSEVTNRFMSALGRKPTVADIPLLGSNIPLPAYPRQTVNAETQLTEIV
jgi:hypothetical protein